MRRPFEPWKVRAWQRHRRLQPGGRMRPGRVLSWLLSSITLARIVCLVMLPTVVRIRS